MSDASMRSQTHTHAHTQTERMRAWHPQCPVWHEWVHRSLLFVLLSCVWHACCSFKWREKKLQLEKVAGVPNPGILKPVAAAAAGQQ